MAICSPKDPVVYVASYLEGNAKRWFINLCETGGRPRSWRDFRPLLKAAFFPTHEKEQSRVALFRLRQTASLQEYIDAFSSLSLACEGCHELTKSLLFVEGLHEDLRRQVRQIFPKSLQEAIRTAHVVSDGDRAPEHSFRAPSAHMELDVLSSKSRVWPKKLTALEREPMFREGRCFRCRRMGHMAKNCKQFPNVDCQ